MGKKAEFKGKKQKEKIAAIVGHFGIKKQPNPFGNGQGGFSGSPAPRVALSDHVSMSPPDSR